MYNRISDSYYASEIADYLEKKLIGENCVIQQPSSVNFIKNNSLIFVDNQWCKDFEFSKLEKYSDVLLITNDLKGNKPSSAYIITPTPRLDFIRILEKFFIKKNLVEIHSTAVIDKNAKIGKNVSIGANAYIGSEVIIGDNTVIHPNVVISGKVIIGEDCVIKSNATIGSEGFSFVFNSDNALEHFPQIGGIILGKRVWVGANSTIEKATLDDTILEDDVKVDDLVQIGHNVIIGKSSQITAGVIISGRVKIGSRCWIAPKAAIDNGISIGENALVGMGAIVLKDVLPSSVVVGVPAKEIRKR